LVRSAQRNRPWEHSTGPKTPEGKARTSKNAWKHGERAAFAIQQRRECAELLRRWRELQASKAEFAAAGAAPEPTAAEIHLERP
jgi:hypothetical protein